MPLTRKRLKLLLSYSEQVGVFEWRPGRRKVNGGDMAGFVTEGGYLHLCVDGERYQAHRLVWLYMTGEWPEQEIDHIDGDKLNNVFSNLRLCTRAQNSWNSKRPISNRSGVKGVSWDKRSGRWVAHVKCNGKQHFLGGFSSIEQAAAVVTAKRAELHGEFARNG